MFARYYLEITDTGDKLEDFQTYHEAVEALRREEAEDMKNGNFTPGFYGIGEY